jgi:predicted DNA-binding protein YlxM (UPF0122 family)
MDEKEYKDKFRKAICAHCPKRQPCALTDGICQLVTPCTVCSIKDTCTYLCEQMESYLNRQNIRDPYTISFDRDEHTQDLISFLIYKDSMANTRKGLLNFKKIPWNVLTEREFQVINEHYINGKSYEVLTKELGLSTSSIHSILHGKGKRRGALKKLQEYSFYRFLLKRFSKFLNHKDKRILELYYRRGRTVSSLKRRYETKEATYKRLQRARKTLWRIAKVSRMQKGNSNE